MNLRIALPAVVGLLTFLPVFAASALTWPDFTRKAFDSAQHEGRSIVVVVYADWCGTCRAQEPALEDVALLPEFKEFALFKIDYDRQKEVMTELQLPQRSIIAVYKGGEEIARVYADNSFDSIRELFAFGL